MKSKRLIQMFAVSAFAAVLATCGENDLEDESQDVIDAQEQASDIAEEHPGDSVAIRRAGEEVINEQREAARKMREELKEKGLDTTATTTRE